MHLCTRNERDVFARVHAACMHTYMSHQRSDSVNGLSECYHLRPRCWNSAAMSGETVDVRGKLAEDFAEAVEKYCLLKLAEGSRKRPHRR